MNASDDNTPVKRLRRWWASPPRSGLQRVISPWEYRHLRAFARVRIGGGGAANAAGIICLAYHVYGWAAFFLIRAVLEFVCAYWYFTIVRSASA